MTFAQTKCMPPTLKTPFIFCYNNNSYDVMAGCWLKVSGDRPNFASLVNTLNDILESESDYLQLTG